MSNTQVSRITQIGIYLGKHWRLFINERGWKVLIFGAVISALVSIVLGSGMFVYTMDTFSGRVCADIGLHLGRHIQFDTEHMQGARHNKARTPRRAAYIKLYRFPSYIPGRHMPAAGGNTARHQQRIFDLSQLRSAFRRGMA